MSYGKVMQYAKCIEPIVATEMSTGLTVSAFPHMKPANAKKVEKQLKRASSIQSMKDAPKNTEELYHHMLRTLGNG